VEAAQFCEKLTAEHGGRFRLPTEAEWEYACRAGSQTRFCYGDDPDYTELGQYAWYAGNSGKETHSVGQKKPNQFGVYDMHGNVWEWCSDWYWYSSYENAPIVSPTGPISGQYLVLRGGSWLTRYMFRNRAFTRKTVNSVTRSNRHRSDRRTCPP